MLRTKLSIKTSPGKNYKYKVYRSNLQEEIPANLNQLALMQPIMVCDEEVLQHEAEMISELIDIDLSKVPMSNQLPFKFNYEPLRNEIHHVSVYVDYINPNSGDVPEIKTRTIKLSFNEDGLIIKAITKATDEAEFEDITHLNRVSVQNNTIYIHNNYVSARRVVRADYFMRVVSAYDDDVNIQEGVEYTGPVATGLNKPFLSGQVDDIPLSSATTIPYIQLQPTQGTEGEIYYYRIVAVDSLGNVSDPSGLIATHLSQSLEEIRYELQVSSGRNIWTHVTMLRELDLFNFGKPGTPVYDSLGSLIANSIKKLQENALLLDDSKVNSDNEMSVVFPNVFNAAEPSYRTRETKAFRIKTVDTYGNESIISDEIEKQNVIIPIEKIVIKRMSVSHLNQEERVMPIDIDMPETTIKEYIRKNGVFYETLAHQSLPTNLRISSAQTVVFNDTTEFTTLTAIDLGVTQGNIYNYTVYLIDAYGDVSEGAVKTISV